MLLEKLEGIIKRTNPSCIRFNKLKNFLSNLFSRKPEIPDKQCAALRASAGVVSTSISRIFASTATLRAALGEANLHPIFY